MADSTKAVLLNISQMIDLAIGTPEIGVVDFNMLQTVLHCLAQQQKVLDKNVELRGNITVLPVGRHHAQTITINEYVVDNEDKTSPKKTEISPPPPPSEPETILVVERIKNGSPYSVFANESLQNTLTNFNATQSSPDDLSPVPHTSVPITPHRLNSTEKLSLVTLDKFNRLESTVEDLKNRVYGSMPKNEEILEEVRSQTNLKAITDMWTSLNVSSRLEAAETAISKLSSLVQDVIGESTQLQDALKRSSETSVPAPAPESEHPPNLVLAPSPGLPLSRKDELATIQESLKHLRDDLDKVTNTFNAIIEQINDGLEVPPPLPPPPPSETTLPASTQELHQPESTEESHIPKTSNLTDRVNELEKRMKECCETIQKSEGVLQDQINSFQDQLEYLMKQVAALTQDQNEGKLSPDNMKDLQGLMQLFETVQEMQSQLKQVHETALQLAAEKEDRQYHTNALLEQIELLKTIKLDREDMVEAMAEKADLRMLARKVSHDQFELACDDLSRGLEHALGKLNMQEALWQQALDDIQREIEMKLDKMELSPVKEFFNSKLKQLQENLKQMASLRREAEAAGTKRRLLRDVNCISCDANAVMPMEPPSALPVSKPMPANLSMKPYLSYELDAIRKAQASNLPQRNMHDWETIDKQMTSKSPQKVRSETDKHLCNRYCGGSHTVTTPAQRVARLGHFIKQWGPDVLPLSSGLAAGDDGRLYKVSTVEGATVDPGGAAEITCTPKSPARKVEPSKPPHKPVMINAECNCLEGEYAAK